MFHFRFPLHPCFCIWTLLCQVGGPSPGPDSSGGLVLRGELSPHQHPGDESHPSSPGSFSASVVGSECHSDVQQCHGCHLSAESGQHGLSCIVPHGVGYCSLDPASFCLPVGLVYSREEECCGRQLSRPSDGIVLLARVFETICKVFGCPHPDLFATRADDKLPLYVSPVLGSDSLETGCLSTPLGPSLSLRLPAVCSSSTSIVKSAAFDRALVSSGGSVVATERVLRRSFALVGQQTTRASVRKFHRSLGTLHLHVWKLSSKSSARQAFLKMLQGSQLLTSGDLQRPSTSRSGLCSSVGVIDGVSIPARPLSLR